MPRQAMAERQDRRRRGVEHAEHDGAAYVAAFDWLRAELAALAGRWHGAAHYATGAKSAFREGHRNALDNATRFLMDQARVADSGVPFTEREKSRRDRRLREVYAARGELDKLVAASRWLRNSLARLERVRTTEAAVLRGHVQLDATAGLVRLAEWCAALPAKYEIRSPRNLEQQAARQEREARAARRAMRAR